jgi:hypothetical protein
LPKIFARRIGVAFLVYVQNNPQIKIAFLAVAKINVHTFFGNAGTQVQHV